MQTFITSPGRRFLPIRYLMALVLATAATAQSGIKVTDQDQVLYGSASQCQKPAEVDYAVIQEATPEFKQIEKERIPKGSARYEILAAKMAKRVCRAIRQIARQEGFDCVVVKGSVKNANGRTVADATATVVAKLESTGEERGDRAEEH